VHNEILMEKKALSRCSHPGIVTLFGTCQDATSLFYQMEYLDGGEVWAMLRDPSSKVMLGCHRSVAKFILASALNAVEYMHR
jgi:serine/threonine protein kinase